MILAKIFLLVIFLVVISPEGLRSSLKPDKQLDLIYLLFIFCTQNYLPISAILKTDFLAISAIL